MKRIIIISVLLCFIGFIFFYGFKNYAKSVKDQHCLTTQISSRIFDFNSVELIAEGDLNIQDFQITHGKNKIVVFENGVPQKGIENKHGHCSFSVYHMGKKLDNFAFFKENNWQTYKYSFIIKNTNNTISCTMNVYYNNGLVETTNNFK